MRILITGGEGQLASDLARACARHDVVSLGRSALDITQADSVAAALSRYTPDVVFNTAAFHRVDICESEPESAFLVNAAAPQRLAQACARHGVYLVHFSTDYVFDGHKRTPYTEADSVNPLSVYGASKAAGEMAVRCTTERHLIIRTTGVFGVAGTRTRHGNFVETMLRLGERGEPLSVVSDQTVTPTYASHLATATLRLVERDARGTVHVTNTGSCSWYEFAVEIFRLAGASVAVLPTEQARRPSPAARPAYSVLAHDRLVGFGVADLPHWQQGLQEYFSARSPASSAKV